MRALRAQVIVDPSADAGNDIKLWAVGADGFMFTRKINSVRMFMANCARDNEGTFVFEYIDKPFYVASVNSSADSLANTLSNRRSYEMLNAYTFRAFDGLGDICAEFTYHLNGAVDNYKTFMRALRAQAIVDPSIDAGSDIKLWAVGADGFMFTRKVNSVRVFMANCARDNEGTFVFEYIDKPFYVASVNSSTDSLANTLSNRRSYEMLNGM
ncbi:hypothetical protein GGI20_006055 [Coemansia sp. BCRC 34301]|nr:hypothetical protein GGI20_006055 [Coemansia sp. BCRC 34301]